MRVDLVANMGAYMMIITPGIPILGAWMYHSIYKMEAYDFTCTGVFTTTTPTDAYRGAGRPEATFAVERLMDDLAAELGMDPLELRKKNWIEHHEFPYDTISGMTYDSGNYEAATDEGRRACSTTTGCAPSRRSGGPPRTPSSWASASRPSPRCAVWRRRGCCPR